LDTIGGKQQHLGYFTTLADAAAAYETAANDNFVADYGSRLQLRAQLHRAPHKTASTVQAVP
jgi:hypothetical protein